MNEKDEFQRACYSYWIQYLEILETYEGEVCKTCGTVQGSNYLGWDYWCCDHYDAKVSRKLKFQDKQIRKLLSKQVKGGGLKK